jgi:hypothetical protein
MKKIWLFFIALFSLFLLFGFSTKVSSDPHHSLDFLPVFYDDEWDDIAEGLTFHFEDGTSRISGIETALYDSISDGKLTLQTRRFSSGWQFQPNAGDILGFLINAEDHKVLQSIRELEMHGNHMPANESLIPDFISRVEQLDVFR